MGCVIFARSLPRLSGRLSRMHVTLCSPLSFFFLCFLFFYFFQLSCAAPMHTYTYTYAYGDASPTMEEGDS